MVAGILGIAAGVVLSLISIVFGAMISYCNCGNYGVQYHLPSEVTYLFLVILLLSLVSVIGGIYALRRTNWGWALAGSICSSLVILGIPALILIIGSKQEFIRAGIKLSRIYIPVLDEASKDKFFNTKLEPPSLANMLRCRECTFVDPTLMFSKPWCNAPKPPEINNNQCSTFVKESDSTA